MHSHGYRMRLIKDTSTYWMKPVLWDCFCWHWWLSLILKTYRSSGNLIFGSGSLSVSCFWILPSQHYSDRAVLRDGSLSSPILPFGWSFYNQKAFGVMHRHMSRQTWSKRLFTRKVKPQHMSHQKGRRFRCVCQKHHGIMDGNSASKRKAGANRYACNANSQLVDPGPWGSSCPASSLSLHRVRFRDPERKTAQARLRNLSRAAHSICDSDSTTSLSSIIPEIVMRFLSSPTTAPILLQN